MFKSNKQAVSLTETTSITDIPKWVWSILFIGVVSYLLVLSYMRLDTSAILPITKVKALGDFTFVTEDMLNAALNNGVTELKDKKSLSVFDDKSFFNIDVDGIKNRIEKMAWVNRASVQRVWPDTLVIEIAEHKPMAYWNDEGLVNQDGQIFYPNIKTYPKKLPLFTISGELKNIDKKNIATKSLRYYQDATDMFASINLKITKVKFDARQALTLTLDSGIDLKVGRQNKLYRLQRFTQIYSTLRERASFIENIDMRYTNGFSVKWKQQQAMNKKDFKIKSTQYDV